METPSAGQQDNGHGYSGCATERSSSNFLWLLEDITLIEEALRILRKKVCENQNEDIFPIRSDCLEIADKPSVQEANFKSALRKTSCAPTEDAETLRDRLQKSTRKTAFLLPGEDQSEAEELPGPTEAVNLHVDAPNGERSGLGLAFQKPTILGLCHDDKDLLSCPSEGSSEDALCMYSVFSEFAQGKGWTGSGDPQEGYQEDGLAPGRTLRLLAADNGKAHIDASTDQWQISGTVSVNLPMALADTYKSGSCKLAGTRSRQLRTAIMGGRLKLEDAWREMYLKYEAEAESDKMVQKLNHAVASVQALGSSNQILKARSFSGHTAASTQSTRSPDYGGDHRGMWERFEDGFVRNAPVPPFHPGKLTWDIFGMLFVLVDVFNIPVQLAWSIEAKPGTFAHYFMLINLVFWTIDMILNFNTGQFIDAQLFYERLQVATTYLRSWFALDVLLLAMDVVLLVMGSSDIVFLRGMRALRIIRILRILRLLKLNKMSQALEDVCTSQGQASIILTFSIVKIFVGLCVISHMLACLWYLIGRESEDSATDSWLSTRTAWQTAGDHSLDQYLQSLAYIFGILLANTTDSTMGPSNDIERVFIIIVLIISMLVLGSAIGKISNTITELDRLNSEVASTRVTLRRYLRASDVPMELSTRIIRFAVHSMQLRLRSSLNSDIMSLFSERLGAELLVCQRSSYLFQHPLLMALNIAHPNVMQQVCATVVTRTFADGETAFVMDMWAEKMYFTCHGSWELSESSEERSDGLSPIPQVGASLTESMGHVVTTRISRKGGGHKTSGASCESTDSKPSQFFSGTQWFAELALYVRYTHRSTLLAVTFADALTLTAKDFMECISSLPGAIGMVYKYAEAFIADLWDGRAPPPDKEMLDDCYPKFKSSRALQSLQCQGFRIEEYQSPSLEEVEERLGMLHSLHSKEMTYSNQVVFSVEKIFKELDVQTGAYEEFKQRDEQKRSLAAVLSLLWLHQDGYEDFTRHQPEAVRLSRTEWREMRNFLAWADLSRDKFTAALVWLVIRGLGKVKLLQTLSPVGERSPEQTVMNIMDTCPRLVPSIALLDGEMIDTITRCFKIHRTFNLAQMVQGENTPYDLSELQRCIDQEGWDMLKFYMVCLYGMMSALRGAEEHQSSLFMDQRNAPNVMLCMRCMRALDTTDPRAIYWCYISLRGERLGLGCDSVDGVVISRIACLTRASTKDTVELWDLWQDLTELQRRTFTTHLLSDGIEEVAFSFSFLPLFFANSKSNANLGIKRAIMVLIDLIDMLHEDGHDGGLREGSINVDINDLALFAKEVKNARVFEVMSANVNICFVSPFKRRAQVVTKHWHRVDAENCEEDVIDVAYYLRQTLRLQKSNNAYLEQLFKKPPDPLCDTKPKEATDEGTEVQRDGRSSRRTIHPAMTTSTSERLSASALRTSR
eukprot:TRINITY_DN70415_c0_g1_i1.p1 TRINITY_DN70415_c0_g1~~TRINITY_DN70415_c0_g1_i1.p1  ORF type:complete len:1419 (+),score=263.10 TRINITY_DN70415_c0_g1_i1:85-4341(+)